MITTSISVAMHLIYSSYQGVRAVGRALGYVLPYTTMAAIKNNIDYNTKHLKTGDPLPAFNGKLRVYNMRFCPFAQRTILALNAKNLDYEVVNIDLVDKPEWLTSKSFFGKVPAIELKDGETIYESLVTVEYLDDIYPERKLIPTDPFKRAMDKILIESISPIQTLYIKTVKQPESITEFNINSYKTALAFVEQQLKIRGTTFLDGNEPGFADYMIWPWFERVLVFENNDMFKIDSQKYPLLAQYIQNMLKDPAVSSYLVPKEIFETIHEAYRVGEKPNYDILLGK